MNIVIPVLFGSVEESCHVFSNTHAHQKHLRNGKKKPRLKSFTRRYLNQDYAHATEKQKECAWLVSYYLYLIGIHRWSSLIRDNIERSLRILRGSGEHTGWESPAQASGIWAIAFREVSGE